MAEVERSWMYLENRTCDEYLNGVLAFISAAEEDMKNMNKTAMCCPCHDCENIKKFPHSMHLHAHLIMRGFKKNYQIWNKHGEGVNPSELDQEKDGNKDEGSTSNNIEDQQLTDQDIVSLTEDYDDLIENVNQMMIDAEGNDGYTHGEFAKFQELVRDSKKPLYPGCNNKFTKLYSVLKLLQLKATHGWSDRSFNALLHLLRDMLPKESELPKNTYDAKKTICPLGLEVEKIHACKPQLIYVYIYCIMKTSLCVYNMFKFSFVVPSLIPCYFVDVFGFYMLTGLFLAARYMTQEVKKMNVPVVFLDPECLVLAYIDKNKELVRSYVEKALVLSNFARKEWLMFACNTGGHWIAVVMSIKFTIVRYLDSISDYEYDVSILTGVLDEAFSRFMQGDSKRKKGRIELQHLTKFPCHQQLGGLACGFYAAYHILNAAVAVASMQNVEDFSVPTEPLDQAVLSDLRDRMANFLMSEVISTKGEFHCHSGTY